MLTLFERVVIETGLAPLIAKGAVMRACGRARVPHPESLTRVELFRLLPELEKALAVYLSPVEARERMVEIAKFTRSTSGTLRIDLLDPALDAD